MSPGTSEGNGYLHGVRVVELADEQGEYAGKVLAGLGADVVKVEPPGGNSTRSIGPFLDNEPHPDRSLHFWHYNFGKRGLTADLSKGPGREKLAGLLSTADVFLETTAAGDLGSAGIDRDAVMASNRGLVWVRISAFGDDGPWAGYKGSDLVHLALGGVMSCTGYDRDPMTGEYDLPPIAPQLFQAYHVAGQHAAIATMGALLYRHVSGRGQYLSVAVHECVSKNTELDVPHWVYQRTPVFRQTARHASPARTGRSLALMKDGRYLMAMSAAMGNRNPSLIALLDKYGRAEDLTQPEYSDPAHLAKPEVAQHVTDVMHRFLVQCHSEGPWHEAQQAGQVWTPVRKPEENLADPHWRARDTFFDVEHPEVERSFTYIGAPWVDANVPWRRGPRAPLAGEDNASDNGAAPARKRTAASASVHTSPRGKPFALNNVRIVDFTWWLASGGGPRFLGSLGAEIIKVEWRDRWDLRFNMAAMAPGGREERDRAAAPCPPPPVPQSPEHANRGGFFNDINPGKRGISLNMNHPKGKELMRRLIEVADVVVEGFSPEVMRRWGFGYEQLKEINPTIIYVQQSGMGQQGTYGKYRAVGPIAAALAGIHEMSGLPDPYPPVGIGYSYLDWFGAYNIATAMMAALYRRETTGRGTYIDASQVEIGIYLNGSTILNYTANGTPWRRYGNRSPWKPAAPAGAYRCAGDDRWITITCHTEAEWDGFCSAVGNPAWTRDPRFETLESRLANQDDLDRCVNEAVSSREDYPLMETLQKAGVPAGVCQVAEDRCDRDPQLKHLGWLTELNHSEMGRWPVKEFPVKFSETPPYMGGPIDRASPCYGEDSDEVFETLLGLSAEEVSALRQEGVV